MVSFNFTYFALAFALAGSAFAAPAPISGQLEKRIDHSGRGTFFNVGLGACGKVNKDSDHIVAIASSRFQAAKGGNCDQFVQITNKKNGKKAFGLVRDSCPGCRDGDLDMSPSLFQALGASLDQGVMDIVWHFESKGFHP